MAQIRSLVLPTLFTTMLMLPAVTSNSSPADVQGDSPAARRTFSISVVAIGDSPSTTEQDKTVQALTTKAPAVWLPKIHTLPEPKGAPPFMPDDAGSQQVRAPLELRSFTPDDADSKEVTAPVASTSRPPTSTTTAPPSGLIQAAVPFLSGMQNMVGQAEKMVAPAAEQIRNKAGQAGKFVVPAAEQIQKKAGEAEKLVGPAAEQMQKKASEAEKLVGPAAEQLQHKAQQALRFAEEAKEKSEKSDSTDASGTQERDDSLGLMKAEPTKSKLRNGSTKSIDFQQRFTARKMKFSLITYDKTLVLGCAAVVGITLVAFVARLLTARSQAQTSVETGHESGME